MIYPLLFNHPRSALSNEHGFGLLTMVLMILTLSIATITIMTVIRPSESTRQSVETSTKAKSLRSGIQSYQFSHRDVNGAVAPTNPPTLDSLWVTDGVPCAIDNDPTHFTYLFLQGWCGPYVDRVFSQNADDYKTDGWGTLFSYDPATTLLTSCGPDRVCGGADDVSYSP
jgi:competence protein ComGC